ncbi:MAG: hypothetical protein L3J30_14175 [Marinosulfonomonas sp.]|nr:hypothetical protein [Marinosulfonomonas sp.]
MAKHIKYSARILKYSDRILIARPIEHVFGIVMDVNRAREWDKSVLGVEVIIKGPWNERAKSIRHLKSGNQTLELIETVTGFWRPDHIASAFGISRFLPPTPQQIEDQKLPDINHEYELAEGFTGMFGKSPVTGNSRIELLAGGGNETALQISFGLSLGGYSAIMARISGLFRRKPLKKILNSIKTVAEATPENGDG